LRHYAAGDERRATAAFAAARSAVPGTTMPTLLVPEGHAVHEMFGLVPTDGARTEPLLDAKDGATYVDGTAGDARPTEWPTVFQVVPDAGPARTWYLLPDDPTPPYDAVVPHGPPIAGLPWIHNGAQLAFLGTGLLATAGAGVTLLAASSAERSFWEDHPSYSDAELEAHRDRTNNLVIASAVTGGVAAGALTLGVVSGRW
jgi:hypothetical protein